ncbi:MAG: allantoicase [Propionibacteriales bacterium]|nr:allantoicase [Propionibacteriales bacterium]
MTVPETADFRQLPDLASRVLAGSVVYANDELFAERENLIEPEAPVSSADFGHKGKVYDGWETRRRREPGHDHAIVRLGVPGVVRGVVIDTAWFTGNHPPYASVEATGVEGHPGPDELARADWVTLVEKSPVKGDAENAFPVSDGRRFTHVRLSIYPDGGVARFRVHGEPVPDPRFLDGTIDLAALENGGDVVDCSDMYYSPACNILALGRARIMSDGWENARRRDGGNDHVTTRLCGRGVIRRVEIDTSYFIGNAAGWASLRGVDADAGVDDLDDPEAWFDVVPKTRLQPDTRHLLRSGSDAPATHVRLDVFPDGGLARLRVHGELTPAAREAATLRWLNLLPDEPARSVLAGIAGMDDDAVPRLLARRPFSGMAALPEGVVRALLR